MSRYYDQMPRGSGEAASKLAERLAREDMGDEAYDKARSFADDRAFKLFGVVFIAAFAAVVLGIVLLGY